MLGDDDDDKRLAKNQLFAVLLMTGLMVLWMNFYMKPQQPVPAPGVVTTTATPQPGQTIPPADAITPGAQPLTAENPGSAFLPAIPTDFDPASDNLTLSNERIRLVFTKIGGRLKEANLLFGLNDDKPTQLVPTSTKPDTETEYPFGLLFTDTALTNQLDYRRFEVVSQTPTSVAFGLTVPGQFSVKKTYTLSDKPNLISVAVDFTNLGSEKRILGFDTTPAYRLIWSPDVASHDAYRGVEQTLAWRKDGTNEYLLTSAMEPEDDGRAYSRIVPSAEWIAVKSAYFFVAMRPDFEGSQAWASGAVHDFDFGLGAPRVELVSQATDSRQFSVYIGPSQLNYLKQAWPTLPSAQRFFDFDTMDWFAKLLLRIMNWFHTVIPNYGVSIILLTVVVRMIMFPLTLKQIRSMKRMQLLAPEMEELKKKYANDQQELQTKMMELYRERNINPLGGCLPVLLQLPIFIALYRTFLSSFELYRQPFFSWINDLSEPDRLFQFPWSFSVPLIGSVEYLNVLPLVGAVVMILSMKLTPQPTATQDKTQQMIMNIMPVMFSLMCYNFSSGINLYIITSTTIGIIQSKLIRVTEADKVSLENERKKKKPAQPKKRMHWYDAAQAKKRQVAKEQQRDESRKGAGKKDANNVEN